VFDMAVLFLIFLVLALACFVAATFNPVLRWNLVAAGLAFWVLVAVINQFRAVS
jgi:uncharacterized membrane protein YqjE